MAGEMNGSDPVVAEARQLGWVPKEEWRGDPERWTDAETFVQRGHDVMPILKANNKRLVDQVGQLSGETAELRRLLKESQESIEALKTFSAEITATRVKEAKSEVLAQLKKAKEDGDTEAEVRLTEELTDLKVVEREQKTAAKAPVASPPPAAPGVDPVFLEWVERPENSWFREDEVKQAAAIPIARRLRLDPKNKHLEGAAFFDLVSQEIGKLFGGGKEETPAASKVEGSRGGSGGGNGGSTQRGKGYKDLPADARAACDKQGKQFIGKSTFKTEADWQSYYCQHYFAGDEQ